MSDEQLTEKKVQQMIDDAIRKSSDFSTRKRGDTPTDNDQLVPKNYCDTNTIPVSSLFGAKGDLLVGQDTSVFGRLAVGQNGSILTADSTQPLGVKWGAAPISSILGDGVTASVTAANTVTISTKYPYFAKENGTYSSTDAAPNMDFTYSIGFDPRMILMYAKIDNASISSNYFNAVLQSTPDSVQTPLVWINDSYKIGYKEEDVNPVVWSDYTTAFIKSDLGASLFEYSFLLQSHDSTSTTFRIFRDLGTGTTTVGYKFWFIAFP